MRKDFLLIFLLITNVIFADEISQYLTSESQTLLLVDGVVNAATGHLVLDERDIEIPGPDPLHFARYYQGGNASLFSPFIHQWGYRVGVPFPILLIQYPDRKIHNVIVEQRGSNLLVFDAKKNKGDQDYRGKISQDLLKAGYCNNCEALLNGEPDLISFEVSGTKKEFIVSFGNGAKRTYQFYGKTSCRGEKERLYRLVTEILPSGNHRYYQYDAKNGCRLTQVWTENSSHTKRLNWLKFEHGKEGCTVLSSNGQKADYKIEQKEAKVKIAKIKNLKDSIKFYYNFLSEAHGSHFSETKYDCIIQSWNPYDLYQLTRISKPDGRVLDVCYGGGRVRSIYSSGIADPLYFFLYFWKFTKVEDALGHVRSYAFDKNRLQTFTSNSRWTMLECTSCAL